MRKAFHYYYPSQWITAPDFILSPLYCNEPFEKVQPTILHVETKYKGDCRQLVYATIIRATRCHTFISFGVSCILPILMTKSITVAIQTFLACRRHDICTQLN